MNYKKIAVSIVVAIVLFVAYYGISPLFRNVKVNESIPVASSESVEQEKNETESAQWYDIKGTVGHPASGRVKIIEADGKKYVRYEDLKTINGPDIYVYLAKDLEAREYVNLGPVRATEGNINYEIPQDINPAEYQYVMIWCKQFGVLFNSAEIR